MREGIIELDERGAPRSAPDDAGAFAAGLADLPEEERASRMRDRLTAVTFLRAPERVDAMRELVKPIAALPREAVERVLTAEVEALSHFPARLRARLLQTRMAILAELPRDEAKRQIEVLCAVAPRLSRAAQRDCEEMLLLLPASIARLDDDLGATRLLAVASARRRLTVWATALLWAAAAGGVWLALAPFVLGHDSGASRVNDLGVGLAVAAIAAGVALARPGRDDTIPLALLSLATLAAVWVVVASAVLGDASGVARVHDAVVGAVLAVLTGAVAVWRPGEHPWTLPADAAPGDLGAAAPEAPAHSARVQTRALPEPEAFRERRERGP